MSSARRLWQFLVRQPPVQRVFVKCIFGGGRGRLRRADGNGPADGVVAAPAGAGGGGGMPESQSFVSRLSAEATALDLGVG